MSDFTIVQPDGPLYRLARMPDPWAWPDWAYAGLDGTFGNRWDDPLGSYRVLYACTRRLGAFIETLARFRPDLSVVAGLQEIKGDDDVPPPGIVPLRWLQGRRLGDQFVNWAIFEPPPDTPLELPEADLREIEPDDPDLLDALHLLGLELA
jgi:hypothetical protein